MKLPAHLEKELHTIKLMVEIYCAAHHKTDKRNLCRQCNDLLEYAEKRLSCCPFSDNKPTCGNCKVHCYKKEMSNQVREIMRFSGPKMVWHHPVLTLKHLFDSTRSSSRANSIQKPPN